jgi:hypothetical protein
MSRALAEPNCDGETQRRAIGKKAKSQMGTIERSAQVEEFAYVMAAKKRALTTKVIQINPTSAPRNALALRSPGASEMYLGSTRLSTAT